MKKLMLAGIVTALALSLGACKEDPYALNTSESMVAEAGGRDYAERAGAKFLGCSGTDSPPVDGYVTCSVKDLHPADAKSYDLVCGYKGRGCKRKG